MIEMRRLKTVAIFFNFKFNAVKKLISIYQFIRVLFVSACLFRNTCMSEIYTRLCIILHYYAWYLHVRNTYMKETHACIFRKLWHINLVCRLFLFVWFEYIGYKISQGNTSTIAHQKLQKNIPIWVPKQMVKK